MNGVASHGVENPAHESNDHHHHHHDETEIGKVESNRQEPVANQNA
jgi:hypothetical protein